ncbi:MAG: ZIP family metal transporter [Gammaproteobacteria bacterium]
MSLLLLIIVFTALGGVLSVLAASFFLMMPGRHQEKILPHGVSFAIGALLAASFWGLIPHAFEEIAPDKIQTLSATILAGLLVFFVLEKLLLWRHCHSGSCEAHVHGDETGGHQVAGTLIILGDAIHNFVDGILIAAAFLTDVKLGIVTSLAVAAHEIPQEVGDFAILLQSGYSKAKSLFYNIMASFTTVFGGILAYYGLEDLHDILPYFLALAASSFIYIAVADLIPTLHEKTDIRASLQQIVLISAGVLLICSLHGVAHDIKMESEASLTKNAGVRPDP